MFKPRLLALLLLTTLTTSALADNNPPPQANPAQVLQQGVEILTGYLKDHPQVPQGELIAYLNTQIAPYFDFAQMAEWVAGSLRYRLNEAEWSYLQELLKREILGQLADYLVHYPESQIRYHPIHVSPNQRQLTLRAEITHPQQQPLALAFRLHQSDKGWQVFDVSINGMSAVAHFRSQYQERMRPNRYTYNYR